MVMLPALGMRRPVMHFRSTDLPMPLRPTMTVVSDSSASTERSLRTG
jgi:hypothetical protein